MWKVTINTDTGLMIESQNPNAADSVLIANASALGYNNVEVRTVTDAEHTALLSARLLAQNPNAVIDAQITALEGKTERGMREAMLYTLVSLAAASGVTEPQLYASNYGYRKAKDLDTAIAALRAQRV